ncbi:MAG TPA: thioredoxin domain-containing protein [Myxococcota bacterium]|nr:thioredoxin domain-containing protein [Myxococcota bacterium]HON26471.1 thioredoxin domain-containing protein [Myxococcota bacterium]HOS62739.1 thioredoxin domain-containing protein [Myxococcota bacterium]HPC93293.1 thioredoxin domain-containing protein [Myxococcota bacterium]HPL25965.1 thioredoxin domain-containing protein [Myxococcota bacterium]
MNRGIWIALIVAAIFVGFAIGRWSVPSMQPQEGEQLEAKVEAPKVAESPQAPAQPAPAVAPVQPAPTQPAQVFRPSGELQVPIPAGTVPAKDPSPARGPANAKVILLEISDFQCPVCKRAYEPLRNLPDDFPGLVQVVFKHNALDMHRNAMNAAAASMAAARQGKFDAYADILFENQRALGDEALMSYAERLGLDLEKFKKDFVDPSLRARIKAEGNTATELGARGTPAFIINGRQQVGWASYEAIKQMVQQEITAMDGILASGASIKDARIQRVRSNSSNPELLLDSALGIEFTAK